MNRNNKKNEREGEFFKTKDGDTCTIINYINNKEIYVAFESKRDNIIKTNYGNFQKKLISNPFSKTTFGKGYLGVGDYKCYNKNNQPTKEYACWLGLFNRCYGKRESVYKECSICEEWHCFQNFAKWFDENYYEVENEKMALDKDIKVKGNKIYSPDTCIFVPQRINNLIEKCNKSRGNLPIGVTKQGKKYKAQCNTLEKHVHIGMYNTQEEAFESYKNFKEKYIKEVAKQYKEKIPFSLYEALINYKIEIND